jgi:hypothetical protein
MSMMQMAVSGYLDPAISFLKKTAGAHLYRPGVGWLNNVRAGNYTDTAGKVPSVLDSPVGLTLDALGVRGLELITNGDFDNGTNGWSTYQATISVNNSEIQLTAAVDTNNNQAFPVLENSIVIEQNKLYLVSVRMRSVNGSLPKVAFRDQNYADVLSLGGVDTGGVWVTYTGYLNSGITTFQETPLVFSLAGQTVIGVTTAFFDNMSVRKITGIHARQTTTSNEPVLKLTNNKYNWLFDSTDTLGITLPSGYENATIIDATPTGQVTLQGQNVTGTYNIGPSLSTHGRIILRDTPTARQLALCQGLANRLAGL